MSFFNWFKNESKNESINTSIVLLNNKKFNISTSKLIAKTRYIDWGIDSYDTTFVNKYLYKTNKGNYFILSFRNRQLSDGSKELTKEEALKLYYQCKKKIVNELEAFGVIEEQ